MAHEFFHEMYKMYKNNFKKNALSSICCGFIKFKGVAVKEVLK